MGEEDGGVERVFASYITSRRGDALMTCPRCQGLLVKEYLTAQDGYSESRPCFKCVNCGNYIDLIFNLNRSLHQKGRVYAK